MESEPRELLRLPEAMVVLDELLEADDDECRQRLERLRADDPELAELVQRLLAADRAGDDRLERPPPAPRFEDTAERMLGRRLGAWRLVELIGQGGMGVVFRAERADGQFQQVCALKLIAVGLSHGQAQQRFLRERQILASLKHDNIASLIDGGLSEHGEPWYAMEYVEGIPLDRWCDRQRLELRERVLVFRQVLDAVRYAHSRFVVHRDLKPSNILVTPEGRVKLLDFGVAKLIEDKPGGAATVDLAMTPEYAAPEQVYGETVGPAADIYSLGVLLYQLLVGASPFGGSTGGAALLRQRLGRLQDEAEPLSQVAGRQPPDITQLRRVRPAVLRRHLRGALSAIVHTCLQHDPQRRYLNIDAFDDDLARWLEHRPVRAYRGHWRYRAVQFVRRNRTALSVLAVLLLAIASFTVYRSVQLAQVRYERDLYSQTFNFVTDVIARATSGPEQAGLTVREALDLMLAELDSRELPADMRAWLLGMITDIHTGARDPDTAVEVAERGIEGADGVDPLVQARLHEGQAMAHELAGRHSEALASLDEALSLVERAPPDAFQVAALSRLLTTKVRYGHRQRLVSMIQAEALLQRAIELGDPGRRGPGTSTQERAQAQLALVDAYLLEREYASATRELARVHVELERGGLLGNDLLLDTRIAVQRLVLGETAASTRALEGLLEQWIARYGPDFRNVASVQAQYAEALERSGRIAESVQASEQARRIARRGDSTSMDVIDQDRLLSRRLLRAGAFERADELAAELVRALSDRPEPIARASLIQGWLLRAEIALLLDDVSSADTAMAEADALLQSFDPEAPGYVRALRSFHRMQAEWCLLRGRVDCAERHARQALDTSVSVLDDPHELLLARRSLALAVRAQHGREAEAAALSERYHGEAVDLHGPCNPFAAALLDTRPVPGMRALLDAGGPSC